MPDIVACDKRIEAYSRDEALRFVLKALRNQLMFMSVPDRECAQALARKHQITAEELIALAYQKARNA